MQYLYVHFYYIICFYYTFHVKLYLKKNLPVQDNIIYLEIIGKFKVLLLL